MSEFSVVTAKEREAYQALNDRLQAAGMPEFLNHDAAVVRYWDLLVARFPDYQFLLVEDATGELVGRGHSIPLRFDRDWSALPDGGLDWVLEKGFQDDDIGRQPNVQSALFIVISHHHLGAGLSYRMLAAMRDIGHQKGFGNLIAPVRPSSKSQYPLIPMEDYCRWKRADGSPFDPWIRVHVQSGGVILHPCLEAMIVKDTTARWTDWTGLEFPGDGSYIVPGALVPISVDHSADEASYVEPGVWLLHKTAPRQSS
jgi:hypothetical protein